MEIRRKIEDVEVQLAAAKLKLEREKEKPRPDNITIGKWENEIARFGPELAALKKKEARLIRFVCEKCGYEWSIPSKKCPKCGYKDRGLVGNLLAKFGL